MFTLQTVVCLHSPSRCLVYTVQAHVRFNCFLIFTGIHFSMLLLSIYDEVMDYDEVCFMHLTPGVVHNFPKAVGV